MKCFVFLLSLFFCFSSFCEKVSIKVGHAKKIQASLALPEFHNQGGVGSYGQRAYKRIRSHLYISGFFRLIDPKSFVENVRKVSLKPLSEDENGFDFEKWRIIKTHLLIRGGYKTIGDELALEIYAYYVNSGKLALGKIYRSKQIHFDKIADQFCDDLIKALTGKKSIFSTKIASTVKVRRNKSIYTLDWNGRKPKKSHRNKLPLSFFIPRLVSSRR